MPAPMIAPIPSATRWVGPIARRRPDSAIASTCSAASGLRRKRLMSSQDDIRKSRGGPLGCHAADSSEVRTDAGRICMAPTWAYVRTNSAGKTDHHSTGKTTAEANQELFIFEKGKDGKWRIARYGF